MAPKQFHKAWSASRLSWRTRSQRQLRDMAPMMAQAAIEPFAVDVDDPARVMVKAADHLAESGLLARGTGQGGVKTHVLTDLGRVRVGRSMRFLGGW